MRKTISLNGTWQLWHCKDGQGRADELQGIPWLEGNVPGCAHYDLLRQGRIEDPFFEKNTRKLYDLELEEWWYRTSFEVPAGFPGERTELLFEGLDTFATVWLNGQEIGRHSNMFIPAAFDVTAALRAAQRNELVVHLASPLKAVEGLPLEGASATMNDPERLWARKLDQCYGWDIAPRIVTAGIWRPVTLVTFGRARIGDDFFRTVSLAEGANGQAGHEAPPYNGDACRARVHPAPPFPGAGHEAPPYNGAAAAQVVHDVPVEVLAGSAEGLKVKVTGTCEESRFEAEGPVVDGNARLEITVPEAKLWWTWDLGTPILYELTISLYDGDQLVDQKRRRQGVRTIRLVQEEQGEGKVCYVFELNGVRFFARGMNWTPADCYHALGEGDKHRRLLQMSRDMNLNMLRVWGGGVYEPPAWFEQLDELGILVYQDFMMSCAIYPLHPDFLKIMAQEAEVVIKGLRNFACLGLWSGDNENDCAYWGWFGESIDVRTNLLTRQVLPDAVARFDGTRDYLPSSPYSPDPTVNPQDQFQGDSHVWHHGTPFEDPVYTQDQSRFVSEIGHLSCPSLATVHSFLSPAAAWPNENSVWDHHIGCHEDLGFMPPRRQAMDDSVVAYFGEKPGDLETYVLATQICQGEAYKMWMEHYRQRKAGWESAGVLLWNVADVWPQFSDAVVDYYLRPKLACNYTRWACLPVHVSFLVRPDGTVALHVANDTLRELDATYRVLAQTPGGGVLSQLEGRAQVPANGAQVLVELAELAQVARAAGARLVAQLEVGGELVSSNRLRFDKPRLEEIPRIVAELPPFPGQ